MEHTPPTRLLVIVQKNEPNLLIRVLWFVLVGWWLSAIANNIGWLLNITIIGLPLGLFILNRIPQIATLKAVSHEVRVREDAGGVSYEVHERPQHPFVVRALYFIFVGWWFSLLWLNTAWFMGVTIIGLPISFWMYGAVGKVTTLKR